MTGRRFADETPEVDDALDLRAPSRALPIDEADDADALDADASPRRRRLAAFVVVPVLALGLGAAGWAITRDREATIDAAPVATSVSPSLQRVVNAPNRGAARPTPTIDAAVTGLPQLGGAAAGSRAASVTAKPSPSENRTPTVKATQKKVAAETLQDVVGIRYATQTVNVRALPSTTAEVLGQLDAGQKVSVTSVVRGDFRQVEWKGKAAWVATEFLSSRKPASQSPSTEAPSSQNPGGGISTSPCSKSSSIESGLTPTAVKVYRAICARFPQVTSYGGYRPSADAHGQGRAVDAMISGPVGWEIANWLRANAYSLGVTEVIYEQRIWTTQRSGEGWRWMSDRGGITANHYDHVHVTVR